MKLIDEIENMSWVGFGTLLFLIWLLVFIPALIYEVKTDRYCGSDVCFTVPKGENPERNGDCITNGSERICGSWSVE